MLAAEGGTFHLLRTPLLPVSVNGAGDAPAEDGYGLHGSGLFVLNPPWTLPGMLKTTLPVLGRLLAQDAQAGWSLDGEMK